VPLGREIDDIAGTAQLARRNHKHFTGRDLSPLAGSFVDAEVERERSFELQRYPATHEADAVHRDD
jgi:hypothetical protein